MLGQLLLLAAVGTGIIRAVWPQIAPNIAWSAGLLVGPALFAAVTALGMYVFPGVPGVVVGWVVSLVPAAVLTRRLALRTLWPGWRVAGVWLAVFVVALAARQQYWIPDALVHTPLSASLMAGAFPPRFPWTPDLPAIYHFLPELAIGALNAGFGPGLVLTTEIVGAFVAAGLAVLVMAVAADLGASRLAMAVVLPLLLSPGLWTLLFGERPPAVQAAIPVGLPAAGLRAALGSLYVPDLAAAARTPAEAAPPNIINPHFIWSHGLAVTAALLATARARHTLTGALILALVISALSAIDETVFVALLLALGAYAAVRVLRDRSHWQRQGPMVLALVVGTGLAIVQGGVLTDLIFHASAGLDLARLRAPDPKLAWLGGVRTIGGGLGALTIGTVAMLVVSAAAAYRAKSTALAILVAMALALFAGFALIQFPASPADIARLEGHALNLSAIALAVVLAAAATRLRRRAAWYSGGLVVAGLIVWPTIANSVGRIAEAIADGPRLYVAGSRPTEGRGSFSARASVDAQIAKRQALLDAIAATASPGERILTAQVTVVTAGTGQPAPLGYAEWPHYLGLHGPEYQDALRFLDREALNELDIAFLHVDAAMLSVMTDDARRRLESPSEFQLVFQSAGPRIDALYAVVPQTGDSRDPDPSSFRAFADLAAGRRVLISSAVHPLKRLPLFYTVRSSDSLFGQWGDPGHFRRDVRIQPPTGAPVDLIVLPDALYPSPLDPVHRVPVWTHDRTRVHDLTASVQGQGPAPPIRVDGHSLLSSSGIQIASMPEWSEDWTGTDWVLYREAEPGTGVPAILQRGERWFPGQLATNYPGQRIAIRFNASRGQLEHLGADGGWSAVGDARGPLPAGSYVLTLRFSTHGRPVYFVPIAVMSLGDDSPEERVFTLPGA